GFYPSISRFYPSVFFLTLLFCFYRSFQNKSKHAFSFKKRRGQTTFFHSLSNSRYTGSNLFHHIDSLKQAKNQRISAMALKTKFCRVNSLSQTSRIGYFYTVIKKLNRYSCPFIIIISMRKSIYKRLFKCHFRNFPYFLPRT